MTTMIRHLPRLLNNAYRRVVKRRCPIIAAQELVLACLVEQVRNASSRVTLAERTDALGMPISRIDWRIGESESALRPAAQRADRTGTPTDWFARAFPQRSLKRKISTGVPISLIGLTRPERPEWPTLRNEGLWTGTVRFTELRVFTSREAAYFRPSVTATQR